MHLLDDASRIPTLLTTEELLLLLSPLLLYELLLLFGQSLKHQWTKWHARIHRNTGATRLSSGFSLLSPYTNLSNGEQKKLEWVLYYFRYSGWNLLRGSKGFFFLDIGIALAMFRIFRDSCLLGG